MNHKLFFLAGVILNQLLAGCHPATMNKWKLYKIEVVYSLPYMHTNDSAAIVKDSSILYLFGPYRMYGIAHREDLNIDGIPIYDSLIMTYFIYREQSKYGYYFKRRNDSSGVRMKVDSFLSKRNTAGFADSLIKDIQKISDSVIDKNRYFKTVWINIPYIEKMKLWFDNRLSIVDYSLSKKLDSLGSSRLSKIEILIAKGYSLSKDTGEKFRTISLTQEKLDIVHADTAIIERIKIIKALEEASDPIEISN